MGTQTQADCVPAMNFISNVVWRARRARFGGLDCGRIREMMRVMSRTPWRALTLAAALLSAGCAEFGTPPGAGAASPEAVVSSVREAVRGDDAAQRRALAQARVAQRAAPDAAAARARLGLLLALLPTPLSDYAEAETLLRPLAAAHNEPWAGIAEIALEGVAQRRRLEARARLAETHAAEADRGAARSDERAKHAEERAKQAEARAADAERKLEAMKAIERRVLEREVPRDVRRR